MGKTTTAGNAPVKRGLVASMHGSSAGSDTHCPELLNLGELPDLDVDSKKNRAFCVRRYRLGASSDIWRRGIIDTPGVENASPECEVVIQSGWRENDGRATAVNESVNSLTTDFRLSLAFGFDELGDARLLISENEHPNGNMACPDDATDKFLGASRASSFRGEMCDRMKARC